MDLYINDKDTHFTVKNQDVDFIFILKDKENHELGLQPRPSYTMVLHCWVPVLK